MKKSNGIIHCKLIQNSMYYMGSVLVDPQFFCFLTLSGINSFRPFKISERTVQKYVGRVKETGRIERQHSSFYIGLYGRDWVNFVKPYEDLVTKLMILNRNKCLFYKRGLRAMELILAAS